MKALYGPRLLFVVILAMLWPAPAAVGETQFDLRHGSNCWGYPQRSEDPAAPRNAPGTQRSLNGFVMMAPPTGELMAFCEITPRVRTSNTAASHLLLYHRFTFVAQPGVTVRARVCIYAVSVYAMTCGPETSHPAVTGPVINCNGCPAVTSVIDSQVPIVRIDRQGVFLMVITPANSRVTLRAVQAMYF